MTNIKITLHDTSIAVSQLAKYVRLVSRNQYSCADAMCIARSLINGETWEPPYGSVAYNIKELKDGPWDWTIEQEANPEYDEFTARIAEYKRGEELARLGSEGDTAAAIEFCKMFLEGKMLISAMC